MTFRYQREGYKWIGGEWVKVKPNATGITQQYRTNRKDRRAQRAEARKAKKGTDNG